ncbi:MAG TPA: hypothetical protein VF618_07385 [Thermoanaerobaculia bacterium]
MQDLIVALLISLAKSHPYLLLACVVVGLMWFARSALHKARMFTQTLVREVRGSKAELREWGADLAELRDELTTWKGEP